MMLCVGKNAIKVSLETKTLFFIKFNDRSNNKISSKLAMTEFIQVAEEFNENESIELPLEDDNTLLLSTLQGQFPGACGLKYRNPENKAIRGIRLNESRMHPPNNGWDSQTVYYCVFPKGL